MLLQTEPLDTLFFVMENHLTGEKIIGVKVFFRRIRQYSMVPYERPFLRKIPNISPLPEHQMIQHHP